MEAKPWKGWKKLSRDELNVSSERKKKITNFNIESLKKIETKQIKAANAAIHAEKISNLKQVVKPSLCQSCGNSIAKEKFFVFMLKQKELCRACVQSLHRCANCNTLIANHEVIKGLTVHYCHYCKKQTYCHHQNTNIKPNEGERILGTSGFFSKQTIHELSKIKAHQCIFCTKVSACHPATLHGFSVCIQCSEAFITLKEDAKTLHMKIVTFFFKRYPNALIAPFQLEFGSHHHSPLIFLSAEEHTLQLPFPLPKPLFVETLFKCYTTKIVSELSTKPMVGGEIKFFSIFGLFLFWNTEGFIFEAEKVKRQAMKSPEKEVHLFRKHYRLLENTKQQAYSVYDAYFASIC